MENKYAYLIKAILAGIMIGIGGTIFLSLENKIIGASLFAIGLFIIVTRGLNLYTGKIGYLFENKPSYIVEIIMTLLGNFIGTFLVGYIIRFTRIYNVIHNKSIDLCLAKLDDNVISIFILSIFCGMLMYLAVNGYRDGKDTFTKHASVFICVIVFILCGFEHSIANMYYFSVADMINLNSLMYLIVMILGNAIGSFIFPIASIIIKKLK